MLLNEFGQIELNIAWRHLDQTFIVGQKGTEPVFGCAKDTILESDNKSPEISTISLEVYITIWFNDQSRRHPRSRPQSRFSNEWM